MGREQVSDKLTAYAIYNAKAKNKSIINPLTDTFPKLPSKKYDIIYADPPWDYGGKMQYDKTTIKKENIGFKKDIFISSANLKYPTLKIKELQTLDVRSISAENCILFLWATGPQMANAINLGESWGFEYKTIAFVWDKMIHNPGRYTLSQTEFVLAFKKGKFPEPRGARNVRQFHSFPRGKHSEKPSLFIKEITKMFPNQKKIELFARKNFDGWDNWGLETPSSQVKLFSNEDIVQNK